MLKKNLGSLFILSVLCSGSFAMAAASLGGHLTPPLEVRVEQLMIAQKGLRAVILYVLLVQVGVARLHQAVPVVVLRHLR